MIAACPKCAAEAHPSGRAGSCGPAWTERCQSTLRDSCHAICRVWPGAGSTGLCKGYSVPSLVSLADRKERGRFSSVLVKNTTAEERQSILVPCMGGQVWLFFVIVSLCLFCSGFAFVSRVSVPMYNNLRRKGVRYLPPGH